MFYFHGKYTTMKSLIVISGLVFWPIMVHSQGGIHREPLRSAQPVQAQPAPVHQRPAGAVIAQPAPVQQATQATPVQSVQPVQGNRPVSSGSRPAVRSIQKLNTMNVQRVKLEDNPRNDLKER